MVFITESETITQDTTSGEFWHIWKRPHFVKGLIHAVGQILEKVQDNKCRRIRVERVGDDLHIEIVMKNVDFANYSIGDMTRV